MNLIRAIAAEEWRYWLRSRLVIWAICIFVLMLVCVSILNVLRMQSERIEREHHQTESEQIFLSQPDRHPHRMIHYGHYVFRSSSPLALFDPGLDSVTGKSMFLEGHRQNSATFSASTASADLGSFSALTPATVYQFLAPLLIVLLGYGAITREREAKTLVPLLAQGISGRVLLAGKMLALLSFIGLILFPLMFSALLAVVKGASLFAGLSLVAIYALYLSIWAGLTLLVSSVLLKRSSVIVTLASLWLLFTLVLPSVAVNTASRIAPLAGKIETELSMLTGESDLSDGHKVSDSDMDQLRSNILKQYGVERVEDLEVNIRGLLAQNSEAKLTETMNVYADRRMQEEQRQADIVTNLGWLNPWIAIASASRALSATDLAHHHLFLQQAEELRYEFVQGLNQVHVEQLAYIDDINRNRDKETSERTRMDSGNWQLLDEFHFEPDSIVSRLVNAIHAIAMLLVWMTALCTLLFWAGGRVKP